MLAIAPLYGQKHRAWLDLSNGPSLTIRDPFLVGPGISVAWLTKNDRLMKIKSSVHISPQIFVNFAEQAWELNAMTGTIWPREKTTLEFHYGLGVIGGLLHGKEKGSSSYGFLIDLTTDYEKVEFITIGVPLEFRVQWRVFGLGADANLNLHTPYVGFKVFTRIGLKK